jgi:hypothetical protein
MKKVVLYHYLGTNGTIISPVHIEDTYYIRKIRLIAEEGKALTNGSQTVQSIIVPEENVKDWVEIDYLGQD